MTEIPQNTKEEESQSPAANQNSSDEYEYHEYQLRQLYDVMNPIDGAVDDKLKKFQFVCKECGLVADDIQEGSSLQDCRAAHRHASLPYTSTVPIPSSDFSVHQLRQLFELVRSPDDMLEDEKHMKRFQVVCKLCRFIADHIQEGSSLHDSHAAHRHASLHRDHFDEDISADQPDYSEAELLRIYLADSYTWDYMRPGAPPRSKPAVVTYFVVCKVCKLLVYATEYDQTSCLHENPELQEHALFHSEYLCIDGPTAPELDLEDFKRKQFVMGYEGNVSKEDVYTPVQKGFAKICVLCKSEKCSSTYYRLVPMTTCSICQAYHWIWDCPKSEKLRKPCNRSWDL